LEKKVWRSHVERIATCRIDPPHQPRPRVQLPVVAVVVVVSVESQTSQLHWLPSLLLLLVVVQLMVAKKKKMIRNGVSQALMW
jgi:hypothetical protein